MVAARRRWWGAEAVAAGVVLLWGVYQCFWNIGAANLNADEPIYRAAGWAYVHGDFALNREHPPTAKYILGFAQLVLGEGELAGRIAVALFTLAAGVIIYLWLRREIGWKGALFAAAAWLLLPHGVSSGVRLDRFAVLEPFMVFFTIAACAAAWRWFRTRSWVWLALSGVAMGLAVTSKVSTAVIIPALLALPLLERRVRDTVVGGIAFLAVFGATFVLLYLPMGIRSALTYMLQMQSEHNATGHPVVVAGVAYTHPPWWTNLLYTVEGMGVAATVLLVVAAAFAAVRRPRALGLFVFAVLALTLVFYLVVSRIALAHYYYAWVWMLCVLAGIGFAWLVGPHTRRARRIAARVLAAALAALLVVCAVWTSVAIARERPSGTALVIDTIGLEADDPGTILIGGMADWEYAPYFQWRQTTDAADPSIVAVVTRESPRYPLDPSLLDYLDAHRDALRVESVDGVTVYVDDAARDRLATMNDTQ